MARPQRPLAALPRAVPLLLVTSLALQLAWGTLRAGPQAQVRDLPAAPPAAVLEIAALGEPGVLARLRARFGAEAPELATVEVVAA